MRAAKEDPQLNDEWEKWDADARAVWFRIQFKAKDLLSKKRRITEVKETEQQATGARSAGGSAGSSASGSASGDATSEYTAEDTDTAEDTQEKTAWAAVVPPYPGYQKKKATHEKTDHRRRSHRAVARRMAATRLQ